MEGGRFDFTDGGSYVGEWCDGRAHGLGIATGPENQGEYSGEWNMGFQSQGVYIWPNGKIYSGTWLKGKLHGEGIQLKGRWIYRGAFTTGFCGRYGVRESLTSCAKYEGSWHLNQFDGFGVETNSDGSIYAGAWSKGMRQGLGVRRSAPYEHAAEFSRAVRPAQSQNSIPSGADSERGWKGGSIGTGSGNAATERGRSDERRSGFVLRAVSSLTQTALGTLSRSTSAQRSATPNPEKRSLFQRGIFRKLRKQKSTGDLSIIGGAAASEFSTTSGCGGGNLFHGRSRRAGGSLRSTLSGSSNLVNSQFGRGDKNKNIVNGGHGFSELMEEPMGPNVTETYSGQWNEDRRAGYGIAERSDGLRYVGEWYHNKKDGYGITYHVNGTKEEGRYKENVLIQALNRRSKLFLLRHTKIRDAIEEAVRNAEEAAKKANETAAKSAYQRAQTAQMVAGTADTKAREARRMSEEARSIARDFSPDFLQPGIEWEKQNPLLKNTLLGQNYHAEQTASPKSADRQFQRVNHNTNHSLEVSGGSRQGSFRSSFRRNKQANASDMSPRSHEAHDQGGHHMEEHGTHQKESHGSHRHQDIEPIRLQQTKQMHESYSPPLQRTPAGRPMSRAATTGVTGVVPPGTDQRQIAHHMAQHPHSPYLMSSASQNLDDLDAKQHESAGFARQSRAKPVGEMARPGEGKAAAPAGGRITMGRGQLSHAQEYRAFEVAVFTSHLVPPSQEYHAQVDLVEEDLGRIPHHHRRPTDQQQWAVREVQAGQRNQVYADHHERQPRYPGHELPDGTQIEKYSTLQESYERNLEPTVPRRRTLPSIITDPLLMSKNASKAKAAAALQNKLLQDALNEARIDEDAVHSAENLNAQSASSYIIENGIRKRVRAVHPDQYKRPEDGHQPNFDSNQKSFTDGRRPEWTITYDPYRPAMESTLRMPTTGQAYGATEQTYEPAELSSLPHTYKIESSLSLWNAVAAGGGRDKESSAPDLPSACALSEGRRLYPSGLTHQELEELTSARKLELMEEMKRRKRGEIVIRLADIKDWLRANFVIVFVIMLNAILAFLFFTLVTGSSITTEPGTVQQPTSRSKTRSTVVKLAKKVLKSTLKSSKPKALEPDTTSS